MNVKANWIYKIEWKISNLENMCTPKLEYKLQSSLIYVLCFKIVEWLIYSPALCRSDGVIMDVETGGKERKIALALDKD